MQELQGLGWNNKHVALNENGFVNRQMCSMRLEYMEVYFTMNKSVLVAKIAEKSELNKKQAEVALNAFIESVTEALKAGEKVQLMGFGTFELKERAARVGRNPATGEPTNIAAKKVPTFKAGKGFKDEF